MPKQIHSCVEYHTIMWYVHPVVLSYEKFQAGILPSFFVYNMFVGLLNKYSTHICRIAKHHLRTSLLSEILNSDQRKLNLFERNSRIYIC